jgi:hypothetical protein
MKLRHWIVKFWRNVKRADPWIFEEFKNPGITGVFAPNDRPNSDDSRTISAVSARFLSIFAASIPRAQSCAESDVIRAAPEMLEGKTSHR